MIYVVTAMYAEAYAIITHFRLKKDISHTRFQVFRNKETDICLIVTGSGSVPAAVAVAGICTEYGAGQGDFLLNVGICAGIQGQDVSDKENPCRIGEIFLCSKIREKSTGKTFYPDILYRHGFEEAQIVTGAVAYTTANEDEMERGGFHLYDMEAAAVYQAGAYYFGPHQMSFLKVISDAGDCGSVTAEKVKDLIGRKMESITEYIVCLQSIAHEEHAETFSMDTMQREVDRLCEDMHCSKAMSLSVSQYIRYCILSDIDFVSVIEDMYQEGKLPCKDRKEGKIRFEELKKRLL